MLAPRSDVHLFGMPTATRRHTRPLITSTLILRALAAAITLSSFGAMTIFASENPPLVERAAPPRGRLGRQHQHGGAHAHQAVLTTR